MVGGSSLALSLGIGNYAGIATFVIRLVGLTERLARVTEAKEFSRSSGPMDIVE